MVRVVEGRLCLGYVCEPLRYRTSLVYVVPADLPYFPLVKQDLGRVRRKSERAQSGSVLKFTYLKLRDCLRLLEGRVMLR